MNRKKSTSNLGFPMLVLLFVAVAIVATGGITYVVIKNKQVSARRNIAKVQQRMEEHRVAITLSQTDINSILVGFKLPRELESRQSSLVPIGNALVEVITPIQEETSPADAVVHR